MSKNYDKILENLSYIIRYKYLGEALFKEALEYFEVLDNTLSTTEEKNRAAVLAEDLISRTRDIPEREVISSKRR